MAEANATSLCRPSSPFRLKTPCLNCIRLRRIFDIFDKNCDGIIGVEELCRALDLLGLETDVQEIEATIQSYIRPGYTGLAFEDFEALHKSLNDTYFGAACGCVSCGSGGGGGCSGIEEAVETSDQEEADLTEAFKVFDEDHDGFISAMDLQVVLRKLGMPEGGDIDRVERMILSVDRNQDGKVDFNEFKDMMQNVMVRS